MFPERTNIDFHDYASPQKPSQQELLMDGILNDHSLMTDIRTLSTSPNSLSIYDQDVPQSTVSQTTNNDLFNKFNDLPEFDDMKQFCADDLNNLDLSEGLCRGDQEWNLDENLFESEATAGLTLAALNMPNIMPNLDLSNLSNNMETIKNIDSMILNPERGQLMWGQEPQCVRVKSEPVVASEPSLVQTNTTSIWTTPNFVPVAPVSCVPSAPTVTPAQTTLSSVFLPEQIIIKHESKPDSKVIPSEEIINVFNTIKQSSINLTTDTTKSFPTEPVKTETKPLQSTVKTEPDEGELIYLTVIEVLAPP